MYLFVQVKGQLRTVNTMDYKRTPNQNHPIQWESSDNENHFSSTINLKAVNEQLTLI